MKHAAGGTFAESAVIPASKLAVLPEDIPWVVAGAISNVGATAWTALGELVGEQAGDRVPVHGGSGGVGHMAIQIADDSDCREQKTLFTTHERSDSHRNNRFSIGYRQW